MTGRCRVCREEMDPVLPWDAHPCCDPGPTTSRTRLVTVLRVLVDRLGATPCVPESRTTGEDR